MMRWTLAGVLLGLAAVGLLLRSGEALTWSDLRQVLGLTMLTVGVLMLLPAIAPRLTRLAAPRRSAGTVLASVGIGLLTGAWALSIVLGPAQGVGLVLFLGAMLGVLALAASIAFTRSDGLTSTSGSSDVSVGPGSGTAMPRHARRAA